MPTTLVLLQFAVASVLLAVTPGPSVVLLLAVASERGSRPGIATAIGLALGTATWAAVTAAGLGSLLAARPGLLTAITALGGGYLLWLGTSRLRAPRIERPDGDAGDRPGRALRDGLVVNLLNPSLAIFLASVIPPFLDLDGPPAWQQVLALGAVLVLVSTVVNIGWALVGGAVGRRARAWVGSRRTTVAAGVAYCGLGLLALVAAWR